MEKIFELGVIQDPQQFHRPCQSAQLSIVFETRALSPRTRLQHGQPVGATEVIGAMLDGQVESTTNSAFHHAAQAGSISSEAQVC